MGNLKRRGAGVESEYPRGKLFVVGCSAIIG